MTAELRVMSYNIRYGGVGHESELASMIVTANPDVVVLQEATRPDVVAHLAAAGGYGYFASRVGQSTAYLSRVPVAGHAWHHPRGARHPFLEVVLGDGNPRLFTLHLAAWFSKWSERRRHHEIRALLAGIQEHQHGFHLVLGDFNALAPGAHLDVTQFPRWIRAMVWLSGRDIARDTIGEMLDGGYVDVWRRLHPGDDPGLTFPTWSPHVRLDYAFTPAHSADRIHSCEIVRGPVPGASDHFPILLTIG